MATGKIFPRIAVLIFAIALAARLLNAPLVFAGGLPRMSPLDEMYHWKRITFSAQHFPAVLDLDHDRGERGLYTPWPPLYDLACGAFARASGARDSIAVLWRVIWIPPLAGALCAAIIAMRIGKRYGTIAAIAAGVALATSPFIVTRCSIGDIDHHYLEYPLAFAIVGGCILVCRPPSAGHLKPAVTLALAMAVAMFVQTALLIACGLAFVVLFLFTDGRAGAMAFAIVALIIGAYRLTRQPGYPNGPWFLGWPHAALFGGAALALILRRRPAIALVAGSAMALAFSPAILAGSHFFGGDSWLSTISEFQPAWKGRWEDWLSYAAGFSIGSLLVWDLARRVIRNRDPVGGTIAIFAIVYFPLAVTNRRFDAVAIPLLALAGAIDAAMILRRRLSLLAAAAVALIPAVQLALWMVHPLPPIGSVQLPWIRTALFLQQQPAGRVLSMWSLGHALDVLGQHPVIVDNFGTMPDAIDFNRAQDALLVRDEDSLARYCAGAGVRYIVISNPLRNLIELARLIGVSPELFLVTDRTGQPVRITRLAQATWIWRAYFSRGAALPGQGMFGRPFRHFRLAYVDPQPILENTPYRGPSLMVWEYVGGR